MIGLGENKNVNKVGSFVCSCSEENLAMTDKMKPPFLLPPERREKNNKPDNIIPNAFNPQSWNLYSYVNGNPVNFNDPTGMTFRLPSKTFNEMMNSIYSDLISKALEVWKGTRGGQEQYTKMKKDPNSTYYLVFGAGPSGSYRGETIPGIWDEGEPAGKEVKPSDSSVVDGKVEHQGVIMYVNLPAIVSSGNSKEQNVKYIVQALAEEAEHALTIASGEYNVQEVGQRNREGGAVDQRVTPRQWSIDEELQKLKICF